jgi:hypothetical protein
LAPRILGLCRTIIYIPYAALTLSCAVDMYSFTKRLQNFIIFFATKEEKIISKVNTAFSVKPEIIYLLNKMSIKFSGCILIKERATKMQLLVFHSGADLECLKVSAIDSFETSGTTCPVTQRHNAEDWSPSISTYPEKYATNYAQLNAASVHYFF